MKFDNRVINIISEGKDDFVKALSFFFFEHTKVTHYEIDGNYGLILYWCGVEGNSAVKKLPYEMGFEAAKEFAWNWLLAAPYCVQPGHDGDNHKGFQVFNEDWTHIKKSWQALVAIKPVWAMYGK